MVGEIVKSTEVGKKCRAIPDCSRNLDDCRSVPDKVVTGEKMKDGGALLHITVKVS